MIEEIPVGTEPISVIDLGTGSSAIALARKHTRPSMQISALASGAEGLGDIRTIIQQAPAHLHASGWWLLLEHGYDQATALRNLLAEAGFAQVQSRRDLAGIERYSGGQITAQSSHL